ncbi:transposase [Aurantimonas manganoxydans SI85-9A1]|uniref:Transposase n=1 Tax=Aurantimonas manganoxydans (strain ATCC BAA-1229 / DSM 21871 / SI85-9A1) TaxID=287752 RepID=Q1YMQ8_AURMS|nr:transposase [Aurantimonas manganoxydans SI85-9A1]
MVGPAAKREAVAHLKAVMGLSERRACSFVGADRKMIRYQSCRPPEIELRGRLRDLANERRRFGYRRLFVLLRREGEPSGINRIYRLYREEGLTVRKRRARGRGRRSWSRRDRTRAGPMTSCTTSSPAGGASVCSTSSMTSRANPWRRSPTLRSPVGGWHVN